MDCYIQVVVLRVGYLSYYVIIELLILVLLNDYYNFAITIFSYYLLLILL